MKNKKTINVDILKAYANNQLERTDIYADQKFKAGICVMIEKVLHESGNYKGYNHIYWQKQGWKEWNEAGKPETWPEKNQYIIGNLGEYARIYY